MSKKQKTYTAEFKTKIVLELLAGDETLAQIASKYSLISRSIQNWKRIFLANASLAFNADAAVADIKTTVIEQEKKIDELHRQLGKRTAEWPGTKDHRFCRHLNKSTESKKHFHSLALSATIPS